MHELDITRSIAEEASHKCKKKGILADKVFLELGSLSGYKSEPIQFFYDAIKEDFVELHKSSIEIKLKKGRAKCNKCKEIFKIEDFWKIICPKCKSKDFDVIDGEDIKLIKITK